MNQIQSLVQRVFIDVKGIGLSEQIQINCPRCQEREGLSKPDGKYNLEINTKKKVFKCWKCDDPFFSGSLGKLIKLYGTRSDLNTYYTISNVGGSILNIGSDVAEELVEIPKEFTPFSKINLSNHIHIKAYSYLVEDRKILIDTILKYRMGFCAEGKYSNRIIIPSFDTEGGINYFVGRSFLKSKNIQPYLNPKSSKNIIFNDGLLNWDSTIYLVEGVFDMISVPNSTPLLGKKLPTELFYKLKKNKPNIVVLLDPDAYDNCIEIFYQLQGAYYGEENKVRIIDLNEFGRNDIDEIRKNRGSKFVRQILFNARTLTIDDYFKRAIQKNESKFRRI